MWVGELLDTDHNVCHTYYLRGPSIKIGRSAENSLVFSSDKSISRVHAEILVDSASSLRIVDCASRYGSSIGGAKLVAKTPTKVEHGSIARFGVGNIRIRFLRMQYSFCPTRLEKPEKDRLKRLAKLLGARMVSHAEQATHVVASKCAATVKMLTAIVVPLKLVTVDWLSFAEGSKVAEPIPPEEEFAPLPTDDVVVREPARSRSSLLASHTVFLTQASDQQYANVLTSCGATVITTYLQEEERGLSTAEVVVAHIASTATATTAVGSDSNLYCLFFDESRGQECEKGLVEQIQAQQVAQEVRWLTAGQLAAGVINFTAPVLTADAPKASRSAGIGASFCSQSQFSAAPSQLPFLASQQLQPVTVPVARHLPTTNSSTVVAATSHASTMGERCTVASADSALGSAMAVPFAESRQVSVKEEQRPAAETGHSGAGPGAAIAKPPVAPAAALVKSAKLTCSVEIASNTGSSSSGGGELGGRKRRVPAAPVHVWDEPDAAGSSSFSSSLQQRGQQQQEEMDEPVLKRSRVEQVVPAPTLSKPAFNSAFLREATVEDGGSDDLLFCEDAGVVVAASAGRSKETAPRRSPRQVQVSDTSPSLSSSSERVVSSEGSSGGVHRGKNSGTAAVADVLPDADVDAAERPRPPRAATNPEEDQGGGGWVTALRGSERAVALQKHRHHLQSSSLSSGNSDDEESDRKSSTVPLQPAEAVEKVTLLCTSSPSEFYGSVTLPGPARPAVSVRNVKVFRKNAVRSVGAGQALSFTAMQMVLPKESEREIQLRLELEARREREVYADHMMTDKFAVGAIKRKL